MRIASLWIALALLAAGCIGSEGAAPAAPSNIEEPIDGKASIEGHVLDDEQQPLADADVGILELPQRVLRTDAEGRFRFTGLDAGTYTVAANKLGHDATNKRVTVEDGGAATVALILPVIALAPDGYHKLQIGQGYLACGAYLVVVTISNLNICPWDSNHKPRYEFTAEKPTTWGVLQELTWQKNQALSTDKMQLYLWYKPVCSPTCSATKSIHQTEGKTPIRVHSDLTKFQPDEKPTYTLSSMTFVGPNDGRPAVVYQQKLTHYITLFYNMKGDAENYTGIPDA